MTSWANAVTARQSNQSRTSPLLYRYVYLAGLKLLGAVLGSRSPPLDHEFFELPRVICIDPDRLVIAEFSDHLDGPLEIPVLIEFAS